MPLDTPEDELEFDIAFALSQLEYSPPKTPDISKRDGYFKAAARAIREQLTCANWTLAKKPPMQIERSGWRLGMVSDHTGHRWPDGKRGE